MIDYKNDLKVLISEYATYYEVVRYFRKKYKLNEDITEAIMRRYRVSFPLFNRVRQSELVDISISDIL